MLPRYTSSTMTKRALITGITGQDGSYLAELLLYFGYEVHGLVRRSSNFTTSRIDHLIEKSLGSTFFLHFGDVMDGSRLSSVISSVKPDEVYNLAAQSHVRVSFDEPVGTSNASGVSVVQILEAIRSAAPEARFYQASSSEMFGNSPAPQNFGTVFAPQSPYAVSKLMGHWSVRNYRDAYGIFACSGVLFNHESPRRGPTFVTKKTASGVAKIAQGEVSSLVLGNLSARRDWGYAPEYVVAMWAMLQAEQPSDWIVGTGTSTSVLDWVGFCGEFAGLPKGDDENWLGYDSRLERPNEVPDLIADPSETFRGLGWNYATGPRELAEIMVRFELSNPTRLSRDFVDWDMILSRTLKGFN